MAELKILSSQVANMIAAGEVVQRPASVVKELVENAVDAGATTVTVGITDSGRTLIQVIDNGCGMSADDAVLCFARHATSKISTAEDLDAIGTFGFRGEALASIAAVSEVTLRTRRREDEVGVQVTISAGEPAVEEVSTPVGCNFAIRNLFFNVPARRKFLKSDNVEFKHIVEEFTRVALTRPDVAFTLTHNGREVYVLKAAKSLKYRVLNLLGSNVVGDVVDVSADTTTVRISGFVGRPDAARKTLGNQFFFVNGRYFRSSYFHKAVMKAYEEFVPEGLTPSYFLYLEVDPHTVDVNIHPTKTEVKFEEDSIIFQTIYACVREVLGKHAFGASIDFDLGSAPSLPVIGKSFDEFHPVDSVQTSFDPEYNPFDPPPMSGGYDFSRFDGGASGADEAPRADTSMPSPASWQHAPERDDYGKLFESKVLPGTQVIVLHGKYILTQSRSGLMLVHIRRANERLLYEKFLHALSQNAHVSQAALFPVQVEVGVESRLLFDEAAPMLASLGFDITPFGTDAVVVNGVPEGYSCEPGKVQKMVEDLVYVLSEGHGALSETMYASMAEKFALLGATSADAPASAFEAQKLIDALFACENAEYTSNGRRILSLLPLEEIDRKF